MLRNLQKSKQSGSSGFTIIEVLIVLAIAGLILLIVFLAVPALQRSSRNTQRKNDVSAILGAISDYESNNNGSLPTGCGYASPSVTFTAGTTSEAKVGYYTGGCGVGAPGAGAIQLVAGAHAAAAGDYLIIATGATCNGTAAVAGSARAIVALYQIENGSGAAGVAAVCQSS